MLPVIFFFLYTSPLPQPDNFVLTEGKEHYVYIVKQRWHTGIVFKVENVSNSEWPMLEDFRDFRYVDVGWGDAEFYQHPGFDAVLAFKALFHRTPSALRVEGFNFSIEEYIQMCDVAVKLNLTIEQFNILCRFINDTYVSSADGEPILLSSRFLGNVKFYAARDAYHLFNTCNTWTARGLEKAGFPINDTIILVEQLLNEISKTGEVVHVKEN